MFVLRPFTVYNAFPCFYGRNKVIYIYNGALRHCIIWGLLSELTYELHSGMCV